MLDSQYGTTAPAMVHAGRLTIDRRERRATLGGRPLALSPLLLRLAGHLAERAGQVVTRTELKRALWPYAQRIDTERRLNTAIRALRAALGDDAEAPKYIETVRSHGYRWIAKAPRKAAVLRMLAFAGVALLSLTPSPLRPIAAVPDLAITLRAQSAMEQWRQQPGAGTAGRASALLSAAAANSGDTPSVLVMRAELELGSQWRWSAAERDYRRAIEQDPDNADARLGLAWLRANQGRRDEALTLVQGLLGNGLVSGDRRASLGWLLIRTGRPDLAAATCGEDTSASVNDLSCSHEALAALGRHAEAKAVALRLMARLPASPADIDRVRQQEPRDAYRTFLGWRARNFLPDNAPWFQKAQVLADAGNTQRAIHALEESVANREPMAIKIASTPGFAALRGDPRFDHLVVVVGA